MKRRLQCLLVGLLAPLIGCAAKSAPPQAGTLPRAAKLKVTKKASERRQRRLYWKDELRNLRTIPALWNSINRHHDALGRAMAQLPADQPTYRVVRPPTHRTPPRERPRPREAPPRRATGAPRRLGRLQQVRSVCHRICRHVRAICFASARICQIADRLGDWPAQAACQRGKTRCQDARRLASRRCAQCPR